MDKKNLFDLFGIMYSDVKNVLNDINNPKKVAKQYLIEQIKENNFNEDTIKNACVIMNVKKILKRTKNLINIIDEAEQIINKDKSIKKINIPDDEWLEYFEDLSSRVSDKAMQKMWARILAKEVTEESSGITKAMLNTISLLDKDSATNFIKLCSLVYTVQVAGGNFYTIPLVLYDIDLTRILQKDGMMYNDLKKDYLSFCPTQNDLQYLSELGLIILSEADRGADIYSQEVMDLVFKGNESVLESGSIYDEEGKYYYIVTGQVNFTRIGLALYDTISSEKYPYLDILLSKFISYQNSEDYLINPL